MYIFTYMLWYIHWINNDYKNKSVLKRERLLFDMVRTQKWEEENDIIIWSQNKVNGIPKTPVQVRRINSGATASA